MRRDRRGIDWGGIDVLCRDLLESSGGRNGYGASRKNSRKAMRNTTSISADCSWSRTRGERSVYRRDNTAPHGPPLSTEELAVMVSNETSGCMDSHPLLLPQLAGMRRYCLGPSPCRNQVKKNTYPPYRPQTVMHGRGGTHEDHCTKFPFDSLKYTNTV